MLPIHTVFSSKRNGVLIDLLEVKFDALLEFSFGFTSNMAKYLL
jgi:hypothetical protein